MSQQLLRLQNLSKYYTSGQSVVMGLTDVSLSFRRGEFVAVTGESGSGKSTLAHVLGGILPYEGGEMFFMGRPTSHFDGTDYARYRRDHISFISQSYGILAGCTVLENVVSALRLSGMEKVPAAAKAREILTLVQLWELRRRRASKLSSGQKQRLSIARALAKPAPILLADEPTGNLDPENSRLVMELLAQAARERLVILITHEFSEAAPFATRHITLQDGRIAMDAALREAPAVPAPAPKPQAKRRSLSPYIARLQLGGRPVWSALMLALMALTAFCVFAFLGTFIIATDDTPTRIYDNSAFRNGNQERIVAVRADAAAMTESDYAAILELPYVAALEPWGYVTDISYGYREGIDYRWENTAQDQGTYDDPDISMHSAAYLTASAGFLHTVPRLPDGDFLTAGRLPESIYEAVIRGDESYIGQTLTVYLQDVKHWSYAALIPIEVEIVGTTGYGQGLYFSDQLGRFFAQDEAYDYDNLLFLPASDLADGQVQCSQYLYDRNVPNGNYYLNALRGNVDASASLIFNEGDIIRLELIINDYGLGPGDEGYLQSWHTLGHTGLCYVSEATFEAVLWDLGCDQVSITIEDYAYTDRVLDALHGLGYNAISPFREGSTNIDPELAQERKQTLSVCAAALLAVVLLQIIVLRAMFGTQTESYRLLSNIGLTCSCARRSILWQVLLFTVLGQGLGLGLLMLCSRLGIERIVYVLRYLPPAYMLLLSAVHLAGALTAAAWILHAVTRQVFPLTLKASDLQLDDEEAAL